MQLDEWLLPRHDRENGKAMITRAEEIAAKVKDVKIPPDVYQATIEGKLLKVSICA